MIKRNLYLNTLLFADDQVIIQDWRQTPETCLYIKPNEQRLQPQSIYGQTKIMAFKGKHLVRSKIEIDRSILEQVRQFNYLGCELSLDGEPDFDKIKQISRNIRH